MAILEARKLTKTFPGVTALDAVDIVVEPGQVHCVVGENGAGKSTLIKCLTGVNQPDAGDIFIDGINTRENTDLYNKIAYVPQEIDLFPQMSVAENLFLPFERHGIHNPIQQQSLSRRAAPLLAKFHLDVDPNANVDEIPVSAQQLLQCVRAIAHEDYDILVLDEPTTSLTTKDIDNLFNIIRNLKSDGKAAIFISHKLDEVLEL
ncbi:MAG: ATP-binding cassette domain-containing protein, partial [Spirochaetaceae bacterium]|nr:ATP-binding cassette domain-containing protein [Spirochaetaceae bacterium]